MIRSLLIFAMILLFSHAAHADVKVITYNVRLDVASDGDNNWQYRRDDMAAYLKAQDADFIAIQEGLASQVEYLKKAMPDYDFIGLGRDDGKSEGEFMAIFYHKSRWQVNAQETKWLSDSPDRPSRGWDAACHRTATIGTFSNPAGEQWTLINTHLDHQGQAARKNSVDLLQTIISKERNSNLILLGDFNLAPDSDLYKKLTSILPDAHLQSERSSNLSLSTFNGFQPSSNVGRIDFIFSQNKVLDYRIDMPKTKDGRQLSDHFPIIATLHPTQSIETGKYLYRTYASHGKSIPYRVLYPNGFDLQKKYPLLLFLHGRGECGVDNEMQLVHGSQLFLNQMQEHPAIVIIPQCPTEDYWACKVSSDQGSFTFSDRSSPNPSLGLVMQMVEDYLQLGFIDENRLYVTGLSMGGMGTWELLWRMPNKIAAAVPICGGGLPAKALNMVNTPIWAVHGTADSVVRAWHSIEMVQAVQLAHGRAKISLYEDVGHNSWDNIFADKGYIPWLFKHTLNK